MKRLPVVLVVLLVVLAVSSLGAFQDRQSPPPTTTLLFPFASNQAGFDTGLAISNTGTFAGACVIHFVSSSNSPPAFTTPTIAAGSTYTNLLSVMAPGFQGFVRVNCAFPQARGWGLLSDLGARNLGASIQAEVSVP